MQKIKKIVRAVFQIWSGLTNQPTNGTDFIGPCLRRSKRKIEKNWKIERRNGNEIKKSMKNWKLGKISKIAKKPRGIPRAKKSLARFSPSLEVNRWQSASLQTKIEKSREGNQSWFITYSRARKIGEGCRHPRTFSSVKHYLCWSVPFKHPQNPQSPRTPVETWLLKILTILDERAASDWRTL